MDNEQTLKEISKGNPGAVSVLTQILYGNEPEKYFDAMKDMNLSGPDVFVGYRAVCNENLKEFKKKVITRDADFVKAINESGLGSGRTIVVGGAIAAAGKGESHGPS